VLCVVLCARLLIIIIIIIICGYIAVELYQYQSHWMNCFMFKAAIVTKLIFKYSIEYLTNGIRVEPCFYKYDQIWFVELSGVTLISYCTNIEPISQVKLPPLLLKVHPQMWCREFGLMTEDSF